MKLKSAQLQMALLYQNKLMPQKRGERQVCFAMTNVDFP